MVNLIKNNDFELLKVFSDKLKNYLRLFLFIGGMPEVVNSYVQNKDFNEVRNIQIRLLDAYEQDFSKHAPTAIAPRIRGLWNNIPTQLAKENKKFIYGLIKEGAREYELALSWLHDCGLIRQVNRVNDSKIPLSAYQDFNAFKLYVLDVGLLCAMAKIDVQTLLDGKCIFVEFKGALTEQFVLNEIIYNSDIQCYYWTSEKGNAEVDFLIQIGKYNIPIEVKANENLQAKSLKSFAQKYNTKISIRTSMSDYRKEEWLVNIPLYCIGNINNIIWKIKKSISKYDKFWFSIKKWSV